jgi:hypothetical protein
MNNRELHSKMQDSGKLSTLPLPFLEKIKVKVENLDLDNRQKTSRKTTRSGDDPGQKNQQLPALHPTKISTHRQNSQGHYLVNCIDPEREDVFHRLYRINSLVRLDLQRPNVSDLVYFNGLVPSTAQLKPIRTRKNGMLILPELVSRRATRRAPLKSILGTQLTHQTMLLHNGDAIDGLGSAGSSHLAIESIKGFAYNNQKNPLPPANSQQQYLCTFFERRPELQTIPHLVSRKSCSFIIDGTTGLVLGGVGRKCFDDALTFNFQTQEIRKQRNFLFQRTDHMTLRLDGFALIHGGQVFLDYLNRKVLSDLFLYYWSELTRARQSPLSQPKTESGSEASPPAGRTHRIHLSEQRHLARRSQRK